MLAKVSGVGSTGRPASRGLQPRFNPTHSLKDFTTHGLHCRCYSLIMSPDISAPAPSPVLAIPSKAISQSALHKGKVLLSNAITADMNPASTTCTLQGVRGLAYTLPTRNTVVLGHYLKTTEQSSKKEIPKLQDKTNRNLKYPKLPGKCQAAAQKHKNTNKTVGSYTALSLLVLLEKYNNSVHHVKVRMSWLTSH